MGEGQVARPNSFLWASVLVLLVAAVFRLIAIHDVPPGLSQDEVLNADIVTFIRQGRHALFFREGFGHEPLYHYWSVPFQILLGDNVLSIRLPAVFLGMVLIAVMMRWAKREFGAIVAISAGMGLAISWWPIVFSRVGIRPVLEALLLVFAALHWPRRPWMAGVLLGLTLYSYTAARVILLLPAGLLVYLLILRRRGSEGEQSQGGYGDIRATVIILALAIVVTVPLAWTLQADPSLQERVRQLEGPLQALEEGDVRPVLESTLATLSVFAFGGDPRWTYTVPARPLFDPVTAALFGLGAVLALTRMGRLRYAFVIIWLGVGMLPSAITPQAPSTIRLIGSLPVVYLLPGIAVARCWRIISDRGKTTGAGIWFERGYGLVLGALLLANVGRTVRDGFIRWPSELETRLRYQSVLLDMSRHYRSGNGAALVIATGFFEPISADSFRRNLGFDPEARWIQTGADAAGAVVIPAGQDGATARFLYVPEFAPLDPELMQITGISSQPLFRSNERPSFAVHGLPAGLTAPAIPMNLNFEDRLTLLGYERNPALPDEPLKLFTTWQVQGSLPRDLAIFVHLLDQDGQIVGQHDGLDAAAVTLKPGDLILQRHVLQIPADGASGAYSLQAGLYTRGDGRRLSHPGATHGTVILEEGLFLTERE